MVGTNAAESKLHFSAALILCFLFRSFYVLWKIEDYTKESKATDVLFSCSADNKLTTILVQGMSLGAALIEVCSSRLTCEWCFFICYLWLSVSCVSYYIWYLHEWTSRLNGDAKRLNSSLHTVGAERGLFYEFLINLCLLPVAVAICVRVSNNLEMDDISAALQFIMTMIYYWYYWATVLKPCARTMQCNMLFALNMMAGVERVKQEWNLNIIIL